MNKILLILALAFLCISPHKHAKCSDLSELQSSVKKEENKSNETGKKLVAIYIKYANLATIEDINDVKKHILFRKRAKEIEELNLSQQIYNWTGTVKEIEVDTHFNSKYQETGNITIEFAPNVEINIPFSFLNDEKIAETIGELQIGDTIKFSGVLEKYEDKELSTIYHSPYSPGIKKSPFKTRMIVKIESISLLQKKEKTLDELGLEKLAKEPIQYRIK
ncbi:MAG: hypothetical protein IJZ59_06055 [Alphaproteobacteria bacterium]|nr:hypothetical protein [Alphaproteobacteria bacterium]